MIRELSNSPCRKSDVRLDDTNVDTATTLLQQMVVYER